MADPELRRRGEAFNRTLRTVERDLERAYFTAPGPYDDPTGPSQISDLLVATKPHDPTHADAVARLRRAYPDRAEKITRAAANTISADVAGLIDTLAVPDWIYDVAARRSAWAETLLRRLQTIPLAFGGWPFLPDLPPVTPAPSLPAEKTEIDSATIAVGGSSVPPHVVGRTANVAWPAFANSGGDAILVPLIESVTLGLARYVTDELEAAATTATDLPTALDALAGAGYVADLVVGSQAALAQIGAPVTAELRATGVNVLPALYVDGLLVVSTSGVFAAIQERSAAQTGLPNPATVDEPLIGGVGVFATRAAALSIAPGSVAMVAAGVSARKAAA
jgi:hypothetical protein